MEDQYSLRLEKIEEVLKKWLPKKPDSAWLNTIFGSQYQPEISPELAASLSDPGRELVNRGGKRWRPLLMVLTAESIAGETGAEAALPLTPLVEFSHNASLIHDDIEDNSDERRGKPALHLVYGTDTAINSGSFMYFLSLACIDKNAALSAELKNRIWAAWAFHMRALHLGQAMDIAWHRDFLSLPGLDEYDRMCRLKTGCLARLAAVLGVYCAASGLETATREALVKNFAGAAEELGVGFQILDDVKNLSAGVPGKKRGDDVVEGKKSLPVLLYLHRYPEKRDFAARCFAAARASGTAAPELEDFIRALESAGVLEEARLKGLEYIRKSREKIAAPEVSGFPPGKEAASLLAGLIDSVSVS